MCIIFTEMSESKQTESKFDSVKQTGISKMNFYGPIILNSIAVRWK